MEGRFKQMTGMPFELSMEAENNFIRLITVAAEQDVADQRPAAVESKPE